MKKQIKEMTNILYEYTKKYGIAASVVILENYAKILYNAGYRKQEWHDVSDGLPNVDGTYIAYRTDGHTFPVKFYANPNGGGRWGTRSGGRTIVQWTETPKAPREG